MSNQKITMKINKNVHDQLKVIWKEFSNGSTLSDVIENLITCYEYCKSEAKDEQINRERKQKMEGV